MAAKRGIKRDDRFEVSNVFPKNIKQNRGRLREKKRNKCDITADC